MAQNVVDLALKVKAGQVKLATLPDRTRARVEFVLHSGSLRHMSGPASAPAPFKSFQGAPDRNATRR